MFCYSLYWIFWIWNLKSVNIATSHFHCTVFLSYQILFLVVYVLFCQYVFTDIQIRVKICGFWSESVTVVRFFRIVIIHRDAKKNQCYKFKGLGWMYVTCTVDDHFSLRLWWLLSSSLVTSELDIWGSLLNPFSMKHYLGEKKDCKVTLSVCRCIHFLCMLSRCCSVVWVRSPCAACREHVAVNWRKKRNSVATGRPEETDHISGSNDEHQKRIFPEFKKSRLNVLLQDRPLVWEVWDLRLGGT